MQKLISTLLVALLLPCFALAVGENKDPVTIITYFQFMELKKADQVKYLKELQELLNTVDFHRAVKEANPTNANSVPGFLEMLLQNTAEAASGIQYSCPKGMQLLFVSGNYLCAEIRKYPCAEGEVGYGTTKDGGIFYCGGRGTNFIKATPLDTGKGDRLPKTGGGAGGKTDGGATGAKPDTGAGTGADTTGGTGGNPPVTGTDQGAAVIDPKTGKPIADATKPATKETPDVCEPVKCDNTPEGRMKAKNDFETRKNDANRRCVMGGLPSSYNYTTRKCQRVTTKKFGSKTYKCKDSETMCNPLYFGVKADNEAICIPVQLEATRTCYEESNKLGANGANALKYLNTPPEPVTTADLEEAWNGMRTQIAELCREKRSATYHCIECTIIWKRLREMNKVSPCSDSCGKTGEDTCRGRIPKYQGNGNTNTGGESTPAKK